MDKDNQSIMFCPKCGMKLPEDSLFCGRCGASLQDFLSDDVDDTKSYTDANASIYYTDKIKRQSCSPTAECTLGSTYRSQRRCFL